MLLEFNLACGLGLNSLSADYLNAGWLEGQLMEYLNRSHGRQSRGSCRKPWLAFEGEQLYTSTGDCGDLKVHSSLTDSGSGSGRSLELSLSWRIQSALPRGTWGQAKKTGVGRKIHVAFEHLWPLFHGPSKSNLGLTELDLSSAGCTAGVAHIHGGAHTCRLAGAQVIDALGLNQQPL
jgi:hypothetical protein